MSSSDDEPEADARDDHPGHRDRSQPAASRSPTNPTREVPASDPTIQSEPTVRSSTPDPAAPAGSGEFDPERILGALTAAGVQFVLIGGFAVNILGYQRATQDIDICYERSRANVSRLIGVLRSLHATPRNWPTEVPFILDEQTIINGDTFTLTTDAGDLDILGTPTGSTGYDDLRPGGVEYELADSLEVVVAGLDDLIRLKRAAGRGKDLIDAAALEQVRDLQR